MLWRGVLNLWDMKVVILLSNLKLWNLIIERQKLMRRRQLFLVLVLLLLPLVLESIIDIFMIFLLSKSKWRILLNNWMNSLTHRRMNFPIFLWVFSQKIQIKGQEFLTWKSDTIRWLKERTLRIYPLHFLN